METKVYNTRQKMQILEMLKANKHKLLTVDEMLFILHASKMSVSRATLYRYLDVLVVAGDVKKFLLNDSDKASYQYIDSVTNCNNHFHLMCIECGKLEHLECVKIVDVVSHIESDHHFKVDPGKVVFYGVCDDCNKK